jgi:hypothetical protein
MELSRAPVLGLRSFQKRGRPRGLRLDDLDELPPLLAPLIEDLLQGVRDERYRRVLPFLHNYLLVLVAKLQ